MKVELVQSARRLMSLAREDDLGPGRALLCSHNSMLLVTLQARGHLPLDIELAGLCWNGSPTHAKDVRAECLLFCLFSARFLHFRASIICLSDLFAARAVEVFW